MASNNVPIPQPIVAHYNSYELAGYSYALTGKDDYKEA